MKDKTIELWLDGGPNSTDKKSIICTWNSGKLQEHCYSLPDYVESNSKRLRAKYLAFIHDVGEYRLNDRSIVEHLCDSHGYNLWWMSKLAEKSHLNSPQLTNCIKLIALEKILVDEKIESVMVHGDTDSRRLLPTIKSLCKNMDIKIFSHIPKGCNRFSIKKYIRKYRPEILSVIFWLFRYIKLHWALRNKKELNWFSGDKSIMIFSYFFGLDVYKCSRGQFYSKQWGVLPQTLQDKGVKINWIHHFMRFNGMSDTSTALSWVGSYNDDPERQGMHGFFESQLSFPLILNVLLSYIRIFLKSFMLANVREAFRLKGSAVDLWPILKNEWYVSVRGGAAIRNCMFIALVDKALKTAPYQKNALYLQENQFWERALIHAWHRHDHGKIIGVPHATVNYWDMRYFDDERTIARNDSFSQPLPDLVALHGPIAKKHFMDAGYPLLNIVEVEALRYLHLNINKHTKYRDKVKDKVNVLIVGEYNLEPTLEVLRAVGKAAHCNKDITLTFKPHPACLINRAMIDIPEIIITNESLELLLPNFDIAIVSGSTSAAVDFYYSGISMIIYLGMDGLNLSPLREFEDVVFIRTADDLKEELVQFDKKSSRKIGDKKFFWTNKDLPRWNLLINKMGYCD